MYPQLTADDFWWFYLALESYNGLFEDTKIVYQWITFTDTATSGAEEPFTLGCKVTVGTETDYEIQYFSQNSTQGQLLFPNSTDVIGQTWSTQAADYMEESGDILWEAGSTYATDAPASTKYNSTNRACYFAKRLQKLGRNPNDFNHNYSVDIGARIYDNSTATTFTEISTQTETLAQGEPASYVVAEVAVETGAISSFIYSMAAAVTALFVLSF